MRLTLQTYYNNTPIIVKVLYHKNDSMWDEALALVENLELITAYESSGKKALDIEELSEDDEFMSDLLEEVVLKLDEISEEEDEDDDRED